PTATLCPVTFSDVHPSDYFYGPVEYLACHNVISGYSDGTFRPYTNTTRGQVVKIVVAGFGLPIPTPPAGAFTFADVLPGTAFFPFVETAAARDIVSGYGCGGPGEPCDPANRPYFRPGLNVTRGQLAKIVALAGVWPPGNPPVGTFADVEPGSVFYGYIEAAVCRSIISGYACGGPGEPCDAQHRPYYRQGTPATRGQIAKIVYGALGAGGGCAVR
ncbi:MAG TPA: S-layer homology domain-containing protein, partial [Chloroflexia bacterium]|nr:S-layer homology domain-containing protein [Chloroflexia bacterium]